jgi:hypothetical protein
LILDRNKTELTHKVTAAAHSWLDSHGFKPVETEVPVAPGWVADLAGVIDPTQTELVNMRLVPRPPCYQYGKTNEDYRVKREAWEALFNPLFRRMSCLVEVKTTRGDFLGDKKWKLMPPVDMAFLAVPTGLIKPEEMPEGWGVLELRGDLVYKTRNPVPRVATVEEHLEVIYAVAIRRDHRTRYATQREWQKEERIERAESQTAARLSNLIDAVRDIVAGKYRWSNEPIESIEHALRYHGIRNVRPYLLERLAEVFGIAASEDKDGGPYKKSEGVEVGA